MTSKPHSELVKRIQGQLDDIPGGGNAQPWRAVYALNELEEQYQALHGAAGALMDYGSYDTADPSPQATRLRELLGDSFPASEPLAGDAPDAASSLGMASEGGGVSNQDTSRS